MTKEKMERLCIKIGRKMMIGKVENGRPIISSMYWAGFKFIRINRCSSKSDAICI